MPYSSFSLWTIRICWVVTFITFIVLAQALIELKTSLGAGAEGVVWVGVALVFMVTLTSVILDFSGALSPTRTGHEISLMIYLITLLVGSLILNIVMGVSCYPLAFCETEDCDAGQIGPAIRILIATHVAFIAELFMVIPVCLQLRSQRTLRGAEDMPLSYTDSYPKVTKTPDNSRYSQAAPGSSDSEEEHIQAPRRAQSRENAPWY